MGGLKKLPCVVLAALVLSASASAWSQVDPAAPGGLLGRGDHHYESATNIESVVVKDGGAQISLRTSAGGRMLLRIRAVGQNALGLRLSSDEKAVTTGPHALLSAMARQHAPLTIIDKPRRGNFGMGVQGLRIVAGGSTFSLIVQDPTGATLLRFAARDDAPALGLRHPRNPQGRARVQPFFNLELDDARNLFGLGPAGTTVERRNTRTTIWLHDKITDPAQADALPVLWSTSGWGAVLATPARTHWDVGATLPGIATLVAEDEGAELVLVPAPSPAAALANLSAVIGRPPVPPKWFFGNWIGRTRYGDRQTIEDVVHGLRTLRFPFDGLLLGLDWSTATAANAISLRWNDNAYPLHKDMLSAWREQGIAAAVTLSPYLPANLPLHRELLRRHWLARRPGGSPALPEGATTAPDDAGADEARADRTVDKAGERVGIVDFTRPDVRDFWHAHMAALLADGVTTMTAGFGAAVPAEAIFEDARTGQMVHNIFPDMVGAQAARALDGRGLAPAIWREHTFLSAERPPGGRVLPAEGTWDGMARCLRAMLVAGLAGDPYAVCDIGGSGEAKPSEELYVRWAQWAMLGPLARFHGASAREPHTFSPATAKRVLHAAQRRYSLIPHLLHSARQAHETGLPIARHLIVHHPDDPEAATVDDQFMLGDDLMIAPIMTAGARSRIVHLPAGHWYLLGEVAEPMTGPVRYTVNVDADNVPVFVRGGGVIARLANPGQHLKGGPSGPVCLDVYPGTGARTIRYDDEGLPLVADVVQNGATVVVRIKPTPIKMQIRLAEKNVRFRATDLRTGKALQPTGTTLQVDATRGAEVELERLRVGS